MNHRFYEGEIFHKRFFPKEHFFTYDYFFLDIDVADINSLNNSLFKINQAGVMGFLAHDHFGATDDFTLNAMELISAMGWEKPTQLRFITLPRIFHFVFNPISMLLVLNELHQVTHAIAEVHNYNGGRVLYPMSFEENSHGELRAKCPKSMYVSPFMGYEGTYTFRIEYTPEHFSLRIELSEGDTEMLVAHFKGSARDYTTATIRSLLCNHTFLSLFVVTRTLWQSFRLKLKGLTFISPRPQDQIKSDLPKSV